VADNVNDKDAEGILIKILNDNIKSLSDSNPTYT